MDTGRTEENLMDEMLKEMERPIPRIQSGEIVSGTVISVTDKDVFVNIGYMTDGIIAKEELSNDKEINPKELLKVGDEIEVYILEVNDGDGNVALSIKRAGAVKVWKTLEMAEKEGSPLSVEVKEIIKGGVLTDIEGIRAFIPASQLSASYVEDLTTYLGKTVLAKIIELDVEKKKVVLSAKEVELEEKEEKKEALWATLIKGERRKGRVRKLEKFGAFVDLGGVDGLIHLSELSWKRVLDPSEVVEVGQEVEVYVLDFDKVKGRISLGLKDVCEDPWESIGNKYKTGDFTEGTILKLLDFGAFVELEPGIEGLVHISEISEERITKPSAVLNIGDKVSVKILEMKEKEKRLSLSIKEAIEKIEEDFSQYNKADTGEVTLGDLLKEKLKGFKFGE